MADEPNRDAAHVGAALGARLLLVAGRDLRSVFAASTLWPSSRQQSAIFTDRVVVVGVTGRTELTPTDRAVLGTHLGDAQTGTVSIRPAMSGTALQPAGPLWEPAAGLRLAVCAHPRCKTGR